MRRLSPNQAVEQFGDRFSSLISHAMRSLLETKHLYQAVTVPHEGLVNELRAKVMGEYQSAFDALVNPIMKRAWVPLAGLNALPPSSMTKSLNTLHFTAPDAKLFCARCDRVEAFNSVSAFDILEPGVLIKTAGIAQIYALSLRCQSCKAVPEVFLIRREDAKLILSGRSPIEHVTVPTDIPKRVRQYYSGGVVAHQSGQTLAGLFLLRTLIEQWVRPLGTAEERADVLLDRYMSMLPDDFKGNFPSIRDLYGKLSACLHKAEASAELFDVARACIDEHFDARRLFKLPPLKERSVTAAGALADISRAGG